MYTLTSLRVVLTIVIVHISETSKIFKSDDDLTVDFSPRNMTATVYVGQYVSSITDPGVGIARVAITIGTNPESDDGSRRERSNRYCDSREQTAYYVLVYYSIVN